MARQLPGGANAGGSGASASDAHAWPGSEVNFAYASGNGSDGSSGLTERDAKKTLSGAIGALAATGGTVVLDPHLTDGIYDVGSGLSLENNGKWYTIKSPDGVVKARQLAATGTATPDPVIYSSTGSIDALIKLSTASGTHNGTGFNALGVAFDLGATVSYGVHAYGHGLGMIRDCHMMGPSVPSIDQYLLATEVDAHSDDCSWWRFLFNHTYHVGLARFGATSGDLGANNQHVVVGNIGNFGALTGAGIRIFGGTRIAEAFNNIEGTPTLGAIYHEQTRQSVFFGSGGENVTPMIRAVGTTNNNGNVHGALGITSNQSGKVLVNDDNAKRNLDLTQFIGQQVGYAERLPVTAVKTTTYSANPWDRMIRTDTTSAGFTVTLPTAVNAYGEVHTVQNEGSGNSVTMAAVAGTISGSVAAGAGATYISDGTNWILFSVAAPTIGTGTITSDMILDGTIVSADLNAAAGITSGQLAGSIAPSKVTGVAVVQTDTVNTLTAPAADFSMNSHKITNLTNGSGAQDAAAFGQIPAAGSALSGVFKAVVLSSDGTTINSSGTGTTLTTQAGLNFAVAASEVWEIDYTLIISAANTAMDIKVNFICPASPTAFYWGPIGTPNNNFGSWGPTGTGNTPVKLSDATSVADSYATANLIEGIAFRLVIRNGSNAGNVSVQIAQSTSDAGNLILKAGSNCKGLRLA